MGRMRHPKKPRAVTMYNTLDVFTAACAAFRLNGKFLAHSEAKYQYDMTKPYVMNDQGHLERPLCRSNVDIMRGVLTSDGDDHAIPEDKEMAEAVMDYWQMKICDVLAETATQFIKSAVNVAIATEIASDDAGIVAILPKIYIENKAREERQKYEEELNFTSTHIGTLGGRFEGDITVIRSFYKADYDKTVYTCACGNNLISFWADNKAFEVDATYRIRAKIKGYYNRTTQMNYVKKL